MAEVSNEVRLIYALWKEKLDRRKNCLRENMKLNDLKKFHDLDIREIEGIEFAENRLADIISDLENKKF